MLITIDANSRRPMYQQIADGIKGLIASGDLVEGQALPSVRQLTADMDVNLNTIATAYRDLQEEGLISIRHGSGAVVSARRTNAASNDELRRTMRSVLAQMVLAGLPRTNIMEIVAEELADFQKGMK